MGESLGEAFPREMARVRDEVLPAYDADGALRAARRVVPTRLRSGYLDDVAQEVRIQAWQYGRQEGSPAGAGLLRVFARRAMRSVFGDSRHRVTWDKNQLVGDIDESGAWVEARRDEVSICFVRLQRVCPTLTPLQRAALLTGLCGSTAEVAREHGVSSASVCNARAKAMARINDPGSFSRVAWRERRAPAEARP